MPCPNDLSTYFQGMCQGSYITHFLDLLPLVTNYFMNILIRRRGMCVRREGVFFDKLARVGAHEKIGSSFTLCRLVIANACELVTYIGNGLRRLSVIWACFF